MAGGQERRKERRGGQRVGLRWARGVGGGGSGQLIYNEGAGEVEYQRINNASWSIW